MPFIAPASKESAIPTRTSRPQPLDRCSQVKLSTGVDAQLRARDTNGVRGLVLLDQRSTQAPGSWEWLPLQGLAALDIPLRVLNMQRQEMMLPILDGARKPRSSASSPATFVSNMSLPVHRWIRYSAGFSGEWAAAVIAKERPEALVLDPFAGSGTTLIAAEQEGIRSVGIESHPFVFQIAKAKLEYRSNSGRYLARCKKILALAESLAETGTKYPPLIEKCFTREALGWLDRLKAASRQIADGTAESELAWLTLVAILRKVSHAGTAPWQYVLPGRSKRRPPEVRDCFQQTVAEFAEDMDLLAHIKGPRATVLKSDARTCVGVEPDSVDLVITSPPYANNYDYADATRLEMCFFDDIRGWADLQGAVRAHLVRSCSQHVTSESVNIESVLQEPRLHPIREHLSAACEKLGEIRKTKGGKKNYHLMAACYFLDLANVWQALRRVCRKGSKVYLVIGDSAPYGVYLNVVEWLEALAIAAGFSGAHFEKFRDRNTKWKNRKHRVPLCEGTLIVEG